NTGFECVNFDFIYGLPEQTADSLTASLRMALAFAPDEIFLYPLYIKHGVRLEREGRKSELDSDHAYALYQCGAAYLRENGYAQISMRRFVRWRSGSALLTDEYPAHEFPESGQPVFSECGLKSALSLGCGGRSYLGRLHFCTPYRTTRDAAIKEIEQYRRTVDFSSVSNGILLSDDELKRRYVIRHLLILPGISKQAYRRAFQADVLEDFPIIRDWIGRGWLEENCHDAGYIGLTQEGLGLSDYIGPQLISERIQERMLEWERENA
ncbi:MAG: radical SAM protein, partial [Lachnospiraceae bacterium]|nr:radical SAM protein [Lachnospiraceae bacterium]